jgi:hypothetical protein
LSDALDVGVDLAVALAVGVEGASVGRALLSDAFDVAVDVAVAHEGRTLLSDTLGVGVEVEVGSPLPLIQNPPRTEVEQEIDS